MRADFALADQAVVPRVHELDRVFDGENVAFDALIDVIDHRRERGRFARAGLARDQNQTIAGTAKLVNGWRHFELLQR